MLSNAPVQCPILVSGIPVAPRYPSQHVRDILTSLPSFSPLSSTPVGSTGAPMAPLSQGFNHPMVLSTFSRQLLLRVLGWMR